MNQAKSLTGFILILLALFLGLNLPDLDNRVSFLVHRSIVTHGFLVPLLIFVIIYREKQTSARFFSMGFNLAAVIHLSFDLFPRAWVGFALIHIPWWGRMNPLVSWVWIGLSIVICYHLTFALADSLVDLILALVSLGLAFSFYATTESVFWPALFTMIGGLTVSLMFPANHRDLLLWLANR